ncbi:hypothetical protein CRE_06697 [Caenorhabditis remanei]|uniref:Uncharacterized protein n=1 Tax=Caenorhabditis remanei TaxID=31234 RepID=E3M105_CAERE|nr:hypothetical protein CRE_06697 [Caenorhabditis remanei]
MFRFFSEGVNGEVNEKLNKLSEGLEEMKKEKEKNEISAEETRRIEAEEQENLKKWILKQESNDEFLLEEIKRTDKEIECEKSAQRSFMRALFMEMKDCREDCNAFGTRVFNEISNLRSDIKELRKLFTSREKERLEKPIKYDQSVSNNEALVSTSDTDSGNGESDFNRMMMKMTKSYDNEEYIREYRTTVKRLEKSVISLHEECTEIRITLDNFKLEFEAMRREQAEKLVSIEQTFRKELEALRNEMLSEKRSESQDIKVILQEALTHPKIIVPIQKSESTSSALKPKSKIPPKDAPIQEAIIGEWKLVSHDKLHNFCEKNKKYKHEVHLENVKFTIDDGKLTSYAFNGKSYVKLKSKAMKKGNNKKNYWHVENDVIKSFDSNGIVDPKASEYSSRYIKKGQLIITNEIGGINCTRVFQRIK